MTPARPKPFVLQREIAGAGSGSQWFDAEAFETQQEAFKWLTHRRWEAQARIDGRGGSGYTGERLQGMRVIKLVEAQSASAAGARSGETPQEVRSEGRQSGDAEGSATPESSQP